MAEERLAVGENVSSLILGVHVLVQPSTVVHISVLESELNLIALFQKVFVQNLDPVVQELKITLLDLCPIHLDI